jgi:hypothetical protein
MAFRFEFDRANKILLMRVEGRLTDESLAEVYRTGLEHWAATDVHASIWDFSFVTEFAVSAEFIHELANQDPAVTDLAKRPRFIVAPTTVGFGPSRMFQIVGEPKRPLLKVVRTLDEALAELGVQSPHFDPYRVTVRSVDVRHLHELRIAGEVAIWTFVNPSTAYLL